MQHMQHSQFEKCNDFYRRRLKPHFRDLVDFPSLLSSWDFELARCLLGSPPWNFRVDDFCEMFLWLMNRIPEPLALVVSTENIAFQSQF